MKAMRFVMLVVLLLGLSVPLWGQIIPSNTGKLSWDLYQMASSGRARRAADEAVAEITVLIILAQDATDQCLDELRALGYQVLGAVGTFVLARAPEDLFIDEIRGVGAVESVVRATLPSSGLTSGDPSAGAALWEGSALSGFSFTLADPAIPVLGSSSRTVEGDLLVIPI